jgi:hypothetical protein
LLDVTFDSINLRGVTIPLSIFQGDTLVEDKFLDILQGDFFIDLGLKCEFFRRKPQYCNLGGQNFLVHSDTFSGFKLSRGVFFLSFIHREDKVSNLIYAISSLCLKLIS